MNTFTKRILSILPGTSCLLWCVGLSAEPIPVNCTDLEKPQVVNYGDFVSGSNCHLNAGQSMSFRFQGKAGEGIFISSYSYDPPEQGNASWWETTRHNSLEIEDPLGDIINVNQFMQFNGLLTNPLHLDGEYIVRIKNTRHSQEPHHFNLTIQRWSAPFDAGFKQLSYSDFSIEEHLDAPAPTPSEGNRYRFRGTAGDELEITVNIDRLPQSASLCMIIYDSDGYWHGKRANCVKSNKTVPKFDVVIEDTIKLPQDGEYVIKLSPQMFVVHDKVVDYALTLRCKAGECNGLAPDYSLDIKANGADDTVTLSNTERVLLTLDIKPGTLQGRDIELWVGAATSKFGRLWLSGSGIWSAAPVPFETGPVQEERSLQLLDYILPVGAYQFFATFDLIADGVYTAQGDSTDAVQVLSELP